jgi:hypothetical protein
MDLIQTALNVAPLVAILIMVVFAVGLTALVANILTDVSAPKVTIYRKRS